jgi:S1-C subfamily serine protease
MMMLAVLAAVAATELRSMAVDAHGAVKPVPDDTLRYSIARFQTIVAERDVLRPWQGTGSQAMYVGSGFLLRWDDQGPMVCTNAHVINDGAAVVMQVPSLGEEQFPAKVVLVNHDQDIAFVRLADEEVVQQFEQKISKDQFKPIELYDGPITQGMEVHAMGFPLGVTSMKLTTGIVSGHQSLGGWLSYQNTAQISPGNSGGPLFVAGTNTVVGINYASLEGEGAEQNNFAVPAFRIKQMLAAYDAKGPEAPVYGQYSKEACDESREMCSIKIPQLATELQPGTKAMYAHYGCETGIFASKVMNHSALATADPPVPSKSFITSVNGIQLDAFGQGIDGKYTKDPVDFYDLAFMHEDPLSTATIETCSCGQKQTHKLSLQYQPENEEPVPFIDEPTFATMDFEQFGDVTVQPLTKNAAQAMMGMGMLQILAYVADAEGPQRQLLITDVSQGSEASQSLTPGMVIDKVNGVASASLSEFRANFQPQGEVTCAAQERAELQKAEQEAPDGGANPLLKLLTSNATNGWSLSTKDGAELVTDFRLQLVVQAHKISSGMAPLTPGVQEGLQGISNELKAMQPEEPEEAEAGTTPAPEEVPEQEDDEVKEEAAVQTTPAPDTDHEAEPANHEAPKDDKPKGKLGALDDEANVEAPGAAPSSGTKDSTEELAALTRKTVAKISDAGVAAAQRAALPSRPPALSKVQTLAAFKDFKGTAKPIEMRQNARRGGLVVTAF